MIVEKTEIPELLIIKPKVWEDDRGYFFEGFNEKAFEESTGLAFEVKQLNFSRSTKNVLRGFHYQNQPSGQAKLICCLDGEILDVAVDIRKGSPTYGQSVSVVLKGSEKTRFFIPVGFAHAFLVLSENAEIMYAVDNHYSPAHDAGVFFDDPMLNIDWGTPKDHFVLSTKDKNLPPLKDANNNFIYHG